MHKRQSSFTIRSNDATTGNSASGPDSPKNGGMTSTRDKVKAPRSKGCRTCVQRRVKCDQTRPACLRCQKTKRPCPGYETTKFINETSSIEGLYNVSGSASQHRSSSPSITSDSGTRAASRTRPHERDSRVQSSMDAVGWPQAPFERSVLLTLMCPSEYQAQLFSNFVESTRSTQRAQTFSSHSAWLAELAQQPRQSKALVSAIRAIGIVHLGRQIQDDVLIQTSRRIYGGALANLNEALQDDAEGFSTDTLSATVLLSFYEIFNCTTKDSWIKHAGGAGQLIRLRGPAAHRTGIAKAVFMACRFSLIMESFSRRTPCFLAEPTWRRLCKELHASSPLRGPVADSTEDFFQEIVSYPNYLRHAWQVMQLGAPDSGSVYSSLSQCQRLRNAFRALQARIVASFEDAGLNPTEAASSEGDTQFPIIYSFPDMQVASLYCSFWVISTAVNVAIVALEVKLDRLQKKNLPTFPSCMAADNFKVVQKWTNNENQSLRAVSPNAVTKPLWDAALCVQSHPYLVENGLYAREICKSTEYMSRAPFLGPLFLVVSLHMALRVLVNTDEKLWIIQRLYDLGRRIDLAKTGIEITEQQRPPSQAEPQRQPVQTGANIDAE